MKLILTQEVSGLGEPGEVVQVKDGYGRNYLLPRSLATPWTKGGQKQVDDIRRARRAREIASVEEAQSVRATLQEQPVRLSANAGQGGRLFGAITPADVAEAVRAATGKDVDRRKVEIGQPIKSLGSYTVTVRLHPDVQASVDVEVVPSA
ncbi:50S ribosomal protein L9 [Pseudokineococcus marinus]|uniref:Large ribosomal subunit protein bL9 n=1 Tax=Pseudokineococcus marinus TaxID=351215 RepID=A0A849BPL5_9ACTN|nr:50S ribosomal protein L9 [Pseudokineococcus marinus]NNH23293.1 50S ribosomal protein L9 [Pseudokineococcus marinus]